MSTVTAYSDTSLTDYIGLEIRHEEPQISEHLDWDAACIVCHGGARHLSVLISNLSHVFTGRDK